MVVRVAHLADIHIHKSIKRHEEYKQVFNELIISLRTEKPDRIVIVGDLFNDYIKLEGELLVLVTKFLHALTKIAPVVITRGNHDVLKAASNRIDSIQAVVESIANPNIKYLNTTGMVEDENIVWCVWKHGEKRNNPWPKDFVKQKGKTYIDLYHDPINGCVDPNGYEFNGRTYRSIGDFKGDYSFFGDIHKHQYFENNTKAYSGSLIAQNYSEGDDEFHGYILWNIADGSHKDIKIKNDHNYHTVVVNRFTDFDGLSIDIPNISPKPSIRVKWQTLPALKNTENERKLWKYLSDKFAPISYKHKNEFVEENKIDNQEVSTFDNITKREVLHTIFTDYLKKIGHEDDIIESVLKLDEIIESRMVIDELTNIQWSIVKFWGRNFRNIKTIDIDWRDKDGLYQITGKNTAGKSSIIQLLSYIQHGKTIETDSRKKNGDARFVNNRSNASSCEGGLVIECNGEYYGIKRVTTLTRNKENEITKASTVVNYYKLASPDEDFSSANDLASLDEERRTATQKRINEIIGTYDNFLRITLTTADSLNSILTTDNAEFLDAILMDAGLDVFDQRLTEFKNYKKAIIATDRVNCNLETEALAISMLENQIIEKNSAIKNTKDSIIEIDGHISNYNDQLSDVSKKYHQIDPEIANIDVNKIHSSIAAFNLSIEALRNEEKGLNDQITKLKSTYDINRIAELTIKRDNHKNEEFKLRTEINNHKLAREQVISSMHKFNGEIEMLKRDGKSKKDQIATLTTSKNSKTCPTCGQEENAASIHKINESIRALEIEMFSIANRIKEKGDNIPFQKTMDDHERAIAMIEEDINKKSIGFEEITVELGRLANDKAEVEKRERLVAELGSYPVKIENLLLKISTEQTKITRINDLQDKINENKVLDIALNEVKSKLAFLKSNRDDLLRIISQAEGDITFNTKQIDVKRDLIRRFKEQEKNDRVMDIYMGCIHRDGVPTQILRNYLLPKINNTLSDFLQSVDFNVWLDEADLKLKMSYATHPEAVIECLGGSGKERTFSSISLKVALNEINIKSKPSLFMLDEVMGKLKDESVDEFLEFVKIIKTKVKKLIIIEQNHEIQPDYVISAVVDSNKISTITLEE